MKIYTEEQVRKAMIEARLSPWLKTDFLLQDFTPIELPSDEEIDKQLPNGMEGNYVSGFYDGVDWLIEQIKQQVIP